VPPPSATAARPAGAAAEVVKAPAPALLQRPLEKLKGEAVLIGQPGGAQFISLWPAGSDKTEIDWRRLGAHGEELGSTRRLRVTSGQVATLRAVQLKDRLAVAWCSQTSRKKQVYGFLWLGETGEPQGGVIELGIASGQDCQLALLSEDDSVLVLRHGIKRGLIAKERPHLLHERMPNGEEITYEEEGDDDIDYPLLVSRLTPGAAPVAIANPILSRHASDEDAEHLEGSGTIKWWGINTQYGVLLAYNSLDLGGGPFIDISLLEPRKKGAPDVGGADGASLSDLLWTGSALVLFGNSDHRHRLDEAEEDEPGGASATMMSVRRSGKKGKSELHDGWPEGPWPAILQTRIECEKGRLRVSYSGTKKLKVTLDSAAPGVLFDVRSALHPFFDSIKSAAWTGESLLLWTAHKLLSYSCEAGRIELAPDPRLICGAGEGCARPGLLSRPLVFDEKVSDKELKMLRQQLREELAPFEKTDKKLKLAVGRADLNQDGEADLVVQLRNPAACDKHGCLSYVVLATSPRGSDGNAAEKALDPPSPLTLKSLPRSGLRLFFNPLFALPDLYVPDGGVYHLASQ
jgi:hypothetical protein